MSDRAAFWVVFTLALAFTLFVTSRNPTVGLGELGAVAGLMFLIALFVDQLNERFDYE